MFKGAENGTVYYCQYYRNKQYTLFVFVMCTIDYFCLIRAGLWKQGGWIPILNFFLISCYRLTPNYAVGIRNIFIF